MIKAVVFDMDGVIVDSLHIYLDGLNKVFRKHGVTVTREEFIDIWILGKGSTEKFIKDNKLDVSIDQIRKEKADLFRNYGVEKLKEVPGAVKLIKELSSEFPLGLATSSYPHNVDAVFKKFNIGGYFKHIIHVDDVENIKPHPEPYIKIASKLGVKPEECVAIEDAESGMLSAKGAGMKCIVFPNGFTKDQDFSQADLVVKSLDEINAEVIRKL